MWRKIETALAAGSLVLFLLLSYWTYYSDNRLDQLQTGNVQIYGNSGTLIVKIGVEPVGSINWKDPKTWCQRSTMPYDPLAKTQPPGVPKLDWHAFTYSVAPGPAAGQKIRTVVLPAWLILLGLTMLPGLWILRIGRPSQTAHRKRRAKRDQADENPAAPAWRNS